MWSASLIQVSFAHFKGNCPTFLFSDETHQVATAVHFCLSTLFSMLQRQRSKGFAVYHSLFSRFSRRFAIKGEVALLETLLETLLEVASTSSSSPDLFKMATPLPSSKRRRLWGTRLESRTNLQWSDECNSVLFARIPKLYCTALRGKDLFGLIFLRLWK